MDLDSVKESTLQVLSDISDNELSTVTLPILREKVAEAMGLPIEELLGKEKKAVILETFQEFLLSKSEKKSSEDGNADDSVPSESEENIPVKSKKSKVQESKESKDSEKTKKKTESPKKKQEESPKKTVNDKATTTESSSSNSPMKSAPSAKSLQIEKLKSYVYKCGVRKVWKKELDGLNENQCIAKIQGILRELGIEGKPSLEQCKAIKERREFEAELREIDASNIIEGKRRRGSEISLPSKKKQIVLSSESESGDEDTEEQSFKIDLKNFGDSESD